MYVSKSQFLACEHPVFIAPFAEKTIFSPLYCLCSLSCVSVFRAFYLVPLIYYFVAVFALSLIPHCLSYCSFTVSLEIRRCHSSNLVLLQYHVGHSGFFHLHINFRISLSIATKQLARILTGIALNPYIILGSIGISTILKLSIH